MVPTDPGGSHPGGSHLRQRQTMCGTTGARGFRSAEDLPQLPRLPSAGCTMEGPRHLKLKEVSSNGLLVESFWN